MEYEEVQGLWRFEILKGEVPQRSGRGRGSAFQGQKLTGTTMKSIRKAQNL